MFALEQSYPKHIPKHAIGGCSIVAEWIAREMINKGMILYRIYTGEVSFSNGKSHGHTWMQYSKTVYDPTLQQFGTIGDDYDLTTVEYITLHSFSPAHFAKIANRDFFPDKYVQHVMNDEFQSPKFNIIDGVEYYDLKEQPLSITG